MPITPDQARQLILETIIELVPEEGDEDGAIPEEVQEQIEQLQGIMEDDEALKEFAGKLDAEMNQDVQLSLSSQRDFADKVVDNLIDTGKRKGLRITQSAQNRLRRRLKKKPHRNR